LKPTVLLMDDGWRSEEKKDIYIFTIFASEILVVVVRPDVRVITRYWLASIRTIIWKLGDGRRQVKSRSTAVRQVKSRGGWSHEKDTAIANTLVTVTSHDCIITWPHDFGT